MSSKLNIITVGPFPPLRGGISDFHESLVDQLSKKNNVTVLNFKSLYPKIFFPGKTQYSRNKSTFKNVHTILNPINIITWIKGRFLIRKSHTDRLIISYWSFFFIPIYSFLLGSVSRGKRYILFHNVISHEKKTFERFLLTFLINRIDYCIVMNSFNEKLIKEINPNVKIIKNFHPIYKLPFSADSTLRHKKALKVDNKKTILFFGLIRDYKGLDLLINAVGIIKNRMSDLNVLIVGENYESLEPYRKMISSHEMEDNFTFYNKFVDRSDIEKYFLASDLVVLPYKSASQSGVLSLAYNFNRPVLVTNVGGLSDYVSKGKSGFIVDPHSGKISKKIIEFFEQSLFSDMSSYINENKEIFSWESFEKKLNIYE